MSDFMVALGIVAGGILVITIVGFSLDYLLYAKQRREEWRRAYLAELEAEKALHEAMQRERKNNLMEINAEQRSIEQHQNYEEAMRAAELLQELEREDERRERTGYTYRGSLR